MPRTIKENIKLKLNNLRGKVHCAQQCVDKLHDSLESLPLDVNSIMILDDMIVSMDEFVANFDEIITPMNASPQTTEKKLAKGATSYLPSSQVSVKDTENADIVSRVNKLEEVVGAIRSTIHGGEDGEGSPHRGILSHLSVLENSFNDGTQKLISMEQKVRDIDTMKHKVQDIDAMKQKVQDISTFRNEMRAKTVKEDQQKEMDNISFNKRIQSLEVENVTLTEEFKNLKGKFKEAIIENDSYEQRLICVEDAVKNLKEVGVSSKDQGKDVERFEKLENKVQLVVSESDACKKKLTSVEEGLKTVVETKNNLEKNSIKNVNDKIEQIGKNLETTVSDTDSCKDRLTRVEDRLKSVEPIRHGDRDEEVKGLKLQVANLDSLTKTQILQRISVLKNQPTVAFRVWLEHDGPWIHGSVIKGVRRIDFNVGNAFQEKECRILAPVDGIYCFALYLSVDDYNKSTVIFQKYDVTSNEWKDQVWTFAAQREINDSENTNTFLVHLSQGEDIRARVYSGEAFEICLVCGWLISPTV